MKHTVLVLVLLLTASALAWAAPAADAPRLSVQVGHSGQVTSIAVSPDGQLVLTAGDTSAILWRSEGEELRQFPATAEVQCAAFSADRSSVMTGSSDGSIAVWKAASGQQVRRMQGDSTGLIALVGTPDGRVVAASRDGVVRTWDGSGKMTASFAIKHDDSIQCIAFSPDGRLAVSGSQDRTVRLWDVASGREIKRFGGFKDVLQSVCITPDRRFILAGGNDGVARLWDAGSGTLLKTFGPHDDGIAVVALSADGRTACTAGREVESARVWDVASGRERGRLQGHRWPVTALAFSPDGRRIFSGSSDMSARAWDATTLHETARMAGTALPIVDAQFSPDGSLRLAGIGNMHDDTDRNAWLWDATRGRAVALLRGHKEDIRAVRISPDGKRLITSSADTTSRLWFTAGGDARVLQGHSKPVQCAAFSADGRLAVTGGDDNVARVWDVPSGKELRRLGPHKAGVTRVDISPDGRWIATTDTREAAHLWDTASGREVARVGVRASGTVYGSSSPDAVSNVAFTPDSRRLMVRPNFGAPRFYDLTSRTLVGGLTNDDIVADTFAFSPDGRTMMTGSGTVLGQRDFLARMWDMSSGRSVREIDTQAGNVRCGTFSRDGKYLLTCGDDRTGRLWRVSDGREMLRLVAFADGTWVVVDGEGRFDTNNLDRIQGLHWILAADPFTPLPLEIFMREYYEPRLLQRVMAGEAMRPVRALATLNRVQPTVSIPKIEPGPGDVAQVTVEVAAQRASGARDLRLFRDGQLVGAASGDVPIDARSGRATQTFAVRLPHRGSATVELSAYAFNVDGVKSVTARRPTAPPPGAVKKGVAFIVAVGVNVAQDPSLELRFAANDARSMIDVLGSRLAASGNFDEVVKVAVVSEKGPNPAAASKANVREVLDVLAGKVTATKIPGAEKLRAARPEDLVVVFFSSHGYADPGGRFFLVPHDSGPTAAGLSAFTARCISSDELSEWMRNIDAGDLVLILDACHSGATVDTPGFKPGPMGSRGLGQMAYDKGMRVLAATQATDVALESDQIGQGLLAFALTREAIESGQADNGPRDGRITLVEWLDYGVDRVPGLHREVLAGKVPSVGKRTIRDLVLVVGKTRDPIQQPALFDFSRGRPDRPLTK